MDGFPSGQRGQTVNLLLSASMVRIHPLPPRRSKVRFAPFFFVKKNIRPLPCSSFIPKGPACCGYALVNAGITYQPFGNPAAAGWNYRISKLFTVFTLRRAKRLAAFFLCLLKKMTKKSFFRLTNIYETYMMDVSNKNKRGYGYEINHLSRLRE